MSNGKKQKPREEKGIQRVVLVGVTKLPKDKIERRIASMHSDSIRTVYNEFFSIEGRHILSSWPSGTGDSGATAYHFDGCSVVYSRRISFARYVTKVELVTDEIKIFGKTRASNALARQVMAVEPGYLTRMGEGR
jgi:hypothetical protein